MSKKFAVVHFQETDDVAVVPLIWVNGAKCSWPPYQSTGKLRQVALRMVTPNEAWSKYTVRILKSYDTYEAAHRHLKKAEETSDLTSEVEDVGRGKRCKRPRTFSSDSSEESSEDEMGNGTRPKKIANLPIPPTPPSTSLEPIPQPASIEGQLRADMSETDFRKQVLRELSVLRATNNHNRDSLQAILTIVSSRQDQAPCMNNLPESYDTKNLPLQSMEDLKKLEEDLVNEQARNSMISYLSQIGGVDTNDATKRIMKRIFSNSVAAEFSWVGAKKKKSLSSLVLAGLIPKAIRKHPYLKETSEREIEVAVKNWLRHAPERLQAEQKRSLQTNGTAERQDDTASGQD